MSAAAAWDFTADAVLVGSGGGALVAALVARSRGLDVLVLEKTELVGGSTAMSGGGVWVPNSPVMQANGVPDSADDALTYLDAAIGDVGRASSPARRRAYVIGAPRMLSFLLDQGIPFAHLDGYSDFHPDLPGGTVRGRTHEALPFDTNELGPWKPKLRPGQTAGLGLIGLGTELSAMANYNRSAKGVLAAARVESRTFLAKRRGKAMTCQGGALVGRLLQQAVARGVPIWTQASVQELLVEDGAVVGVVVHRDGRDLRVRGRHAVLLGAGGFSRNGDLRARYGTDTVASAQWTVANPGDTGEVLQMAMALGAATDLLDEAIWLPSPRMPDGTPPGPYPPRLMSTFGRARSRPGTIIVDASGRRFANESASFMDLGHAMFARNRETTAVPSWLVFDDGFRRRSLFGAVPGRLPEQWITDGFVKRADTLADLAAQCGVDAAGLEATVERFNELARAGVDADFHRGETAIEAYLGDPMQRPNHCLAPLERAPFYAVALYVADLGTIGGVLADDHARVLDTAGKPIPGLYATGTVTASILGHRYIGAGASIAYTCTFGFLAMHDIADRAEATTRGAERTAQS
jgi:3-oxosteroid 1-dehydrogenase